MKKVAWGMAFYMLSGPIILLAMMAFAMLSMEGASELILYYGSILVSGLCSAGGFYLLMRGDEDLGYGGNIEWVRKISMVLAAYGLAETVLLVLDLMLSKQDGISVLKAISSLERRPITLATSGFITEYVSTAAANRGGR